MAAGRRAKAWSGLVAAIWIFGSKLDIWIFEGGGAADLMVEGNDRG